MRTNTWIFPEFFEKFQVLRPVTSAFNIPIYSNVAWQILAYAIEGMTKKSFEETFEAALKQPLNLTGTFLTPPDLEQVNGITPGGPNESQWLLDPGDRTSSACVPPD